MARIFCQPMIRPTLPLALAARISLTVLTRCQALPGSLGPLPPLRRAVTYGREIAFHMRHGEIDGGNVASLEIRRVAVTHEHEAVDYRCFSMHLRGVGSVLPWFQAWTASGTPSACASCGMTLAANSSRDAMTSRCEAPKLMLRMNSSTRSSA